MSEQRRDESIDRLLKAMQGQHSRVSSADCLDAETLAAWADDHLRGEARAHAESHAASCGRCQALLAAMARTADVAAVMDEAARSGSWISRAVPWLAPLTAAAAAAVLLWMAVIPRVAQQPPAAPPSSVATAPAIVAPARAPASPVAEPPAAHKEIAATTPPDRARPPSASSANQERGALLKAPDAGKPIRAPESRIDAVTDQRAASKPEQQKRDRREATQADAAAARPPAPSTPAGVAGALPRAAAVERPQEPGQLSARSATVREGVISGFRLALIEIKSPDPKVRWRISGGSLIEHSVDGGVTWTNPVTVTDEILASGSAPSPMICWIVGRPGVVLLTVDGRSWERVSFPERIDLVSVNATSADVATVVAADGRSFQTTDGGRNWR